MFEGTEDEGDVAGEGVETQPDRGHPLAGEEAPEEGAGARAAAGTPEISEDANKEETQHPAPDDEAGVPDEPGDSGDEG